MGTTDAFLMIASVLWYLRNCVIIELSWSSADQYLKAHRNQFKTASRYLFGKESTQLTVFSRGRSLWGCSRWWRQWPRRRRTERFECRWRKSCDSRSPSSWTCSSPRTGPGCRQQPRHTPKKSDWRNETICK